MDWMKKWVGNFVASILLSNQGTTISREKAVMISNKTRPWRRMFLMVLVAIGLCWNAIQSTIITNQQQSRKVQSLFHHHQQQQPTNDEKPQFLRKTLGTKNDIDLHTLSSIWIRLHDVAGKVSIILGRSASFSAFVQDFYAQGQTRLHALRVASPSIRRNRLTSASVSNSHTAAATNHG
mmetsp:Transcript_22758/g.47485  ORF Transcript_22758/g.47485 Transcript_22758/m.47485 type:complete len:179 (+) Transcript_22758:197-733(+)